MKVYFASGGEGGLLKEYFEEAVRIKPWHEIVAEEDELIQSQQPAVSRIYLPS